MSLDGFLVITPLKRPSRAARVERGLREEAISLGMVSINLINPAGRY